MAMMIDDDDDSDYDDDNVDYDDANMNIINFIITDNFTNFI